VGCVPHRASGVRPERAAWLGGLIVSDYFLVLGFCEPCFGWCRPLALYRLAVGVTGGRIGWLLFILEEFWLYAGGADVVVDVVCPLGCPCAAV
jgi:hypothetical protein